MLLLDTVFYSLAKRGSIKEWCKVTFGGGFAMPIFGILSAVLLGGFTYLTFTLYEQMNLFIYFMSMIITFIAFYAGCYLFPTRGGKKVRDQFTKWHIDAIKRNFEFNEKYYG